MRYVLFNYVHPDDIAAWEAWTPEEQAADVVVIIDAADMDEAIAIASEWPSLANQPQATVQLQPIFPRD